jgi:hypothetical protein
MTFPHISSTNQEGASPSPTRPQVPTQSSITHSSERLTSSAHSSLFTGTTMASSQKQQENRRHSGSGIMGRSNALPVSRGPSFSSSSRDEMVSGLRGSGGSSAREVSLQSDFNSPGGHNPIPCISSFVWSHRSPPPLHHCFLLLLSGELTASTSILEQSWSK